MRAASKTFLSLTLCLQFIEEGSLNEVPLKLFWSGGKLPKC